MNLTYTIEPEIFAQFPGYVRGVVVATDVTNGPTPPALLALLREAEAATRAALTAETLATQPRIAAWRAAYRAFGAKPTEFRPSVEALIRRVLHGQELPAINALVDIGTLLSLRHLVPTGAHALDNVTDDLALRPATGAETFIPFGGPPDAIEQPPPGEIIFAAGNTVLTRRWTWRQAVHTLTLPTSRTVEFNVDGLPPVLPAEVAQISQEVITLVHHFCGGQAHSVLLSAASPQTYLTI